MKNTALFCLALLALATSCTKKTDDATPTPSAKAGLLTNKNWTLSALTAQKGSISTNAYNELDECDKDDYLRFNDNHTAEANDGLLKCDSSDPQSETGTWELVSNESKLLLTTPLLGTGAAVIPDIVELSSTHMVLRATVIENSVTTTYTATLTPN